MGNKRDKNIHEVKGPIHTRKLSKKSIINRKSRYMRLTKSTETK